MGCNSTKVSVLKESSSFVALKHEPPKKKHIRHKSAPKPSTNSPLILGVDNIQNRSKGGNNSLFVRLKVDESSHAHKNILSKPVRELQVLNSMQLEFKSRKKRSLSHSHLDRSIIYAESSRLTPTESLGTVKFSKDHEISIKKSAFAERGGSLHIGHWQTPIQCSRQPGIDRPTIIKKQSFNIANENELNPFTQNRVLISRRSFDQSHIESVDVQNDSIHLPKLRSIHETANLRAIEKSEHKPRESYFSRNQNNTIITTQFDKQNEVAHHPSSILVKPLNRFISPVRVSDCFFCRNEHMPASLSSHHIKRRIIDSDYDTIKVNQSIRKSIREVRPKYIVFVLVNPLGRHPYRHLINQQLNNFKETTNTLIFENCDKSP